MPRYHAQPPEVTQMPLLIQTELANVLGCLHVCAHLLVSVQVLVCRVGHQDMGLLLFPVEIQVYHLADISRWHPDVLQDDGCLDVASGLQEAIPSTWKLRGIRALAVWLEIQFSKLFGQKDQSRCVQTHWDDEVSV